MQTKPPPRSPTPEELSRILDTLCDPMEYDAAEVGEQLEAARVAVFDGYMSDGPGYTGRVAVIIWAGGPDLFDVVTLDGRHAGIQPHDPSKCPREEPPKPMQQTALDL